MKCGKGRKTGPVPPDRAALGSARRIVIKVGTRVLAQSDGRPDPRRLREIVSQAVALRREGRSVVLVSSGAVGAGMEALGLRRRPRTLPDLQMAAAVGQSRLMAQYDRLFRARRCRVGQVLLTHDGLKMRRRHLNARHTMLNLLRHGIVPIVNENDAVSVDEIKFGDNDILAALVSILIDAHLLVLLTTVNGLRAPAGLRTRRIPRLASVTPAEMELVSGRAGGLSAGGMGSKLQSADLFVKAGGAAVIADGRVPNITPRLLAGEDLGTLIGRVPSDESPRGPGGRRRWIAFFHRVDGSVTVDEGAVHALERRGTSLLPIGVTAVEGSFAAGAVLNVRSRAGRLVARGLTDYSAEEIRRIMGHRTPELAGLLGGRFYEEVIHRDNLIVFSAPEGGPA